MCEAEVLLVDDEEMNNLFLESMLKENYKIISVKTASGKEAHSLFCKRLSQRCCKRKFRMVMTDIQMPEVNGYDLAVLLKHTELNF